MSPARLTTAGPLARRAELAAALARSARPEHQPRPRAARATPLTRRYEMRWLASDGAVVEAARLAPATPLFEAAFSALARGATVATEAGPVAVEDLAPGMSAMTPEGGAIPILWIGRMTFYPGVGDDAAEPVRLTRLTIEALGQGRPAQDLILGPQANLLLRAPRVLRLTGGAPAYAPAAALTDGVSVIGVTPAAPIAVYHLALERHASLRVNGVEVEAYHPEMALSGRPDPRMLTLFAAMFPHLSGLDGFGPRAHSSLPQAQIERLWD